MNTKKTLLSLAASVAAVSLSGQTNDFSIDVGRVGAPIQPTMYGIFIEDINFAADGGLYAELVKNRSFEFPNHLQGWRVGGNVEVREDGPFERNPHYLRLLSSGHPHKYTAVENEGFFGIGLKKDATYRFSVWARMAKPGTKGALQVEFIDRASMDEVQASTTAEINID